MTLHFGLCEWDIQRMPTGSMDVVARNLTNGQSTRLVLKPEEALKLGEAIIKEAMPQNWDKDHLRDITKPYAINLSSIREKPETIGGA